MYQFPCRKQYVLGIFFFCVNLTPRAYCVQSDGLKIDFSIINQKEVQSGEKKSISILTDIVFPPNSGIIDQVSYTLPQDDTLSDSDTDDEGKASGDDKKALTEDKKLDGLPISRNVRNKYNRSRHAPGGQEQDRTYDPCNNYVKGAVDLDKLCIQLSSNAFDIIASEPNDQTKKSTTGLCVALRDKHKRIKKFVFHNGAYVLSPAMRTKAPKLGYDVIQAEQSHAELQFIQFLIRREQVRPGLYTHIMGMGCSRCYCAECNHALKGIVSAKYLKVASSVDHKKDNGASPQSGLISAASKPINSDEVDSSDAVQFTQSITQEISYKVVKDEKSVDDAIYDHCYVPLSLQCTFDKAAGLPHNFSNERFSKPEKAQHSRRKRSK